MSESVEITINGRTVSAAKGELVIAAAERAGAFIPRFCYHPRMSSVGMCRQCLVEIDTGRGPMLQPSCMVTVAPGMAVDTESDTTKRAQEGILELLLANHPLDCPVCDKGGECPLQDQALAHGRNTSTFIDQKRKYDKPVASGGLLRRLFGGGSDHRAQALRDAVLQSAATHAQAERLVWRVLDELPSVTVADLDRWVEEVRPHVGRLAVTEEQLHAVLQGQPQPMEAVLPHLEQWVAQR